MNPAKGAAASQSLVDAPPGTTFKICHRWHSLHLQTGFSLGSCSFLAPSNSWAAWRGSEERAHTHTHTQLLDFPMHCSLQSAVGEPPLAPGPPDLGPLAQRPCLLPYWDTQWTVCVCVNSQSRGVSVIQPFSHQPPASLASGEPSILGSQPSIFLSLSFFSTPTTRSTGTFFVMLCV